jgi:hypothetical protein
MAGKREPEGREKSLNAKEREAALRRRREVLDVLLRVLRGRPA